MSTAPDPPTSEPTEITAGDTIIWKKSLSDYPASDGWTLSYALVFSSEQITISSTADADDHLVEVAAATSANYTAGEYMWQSYVTGDAGKRFKLGAGIITILPNYATQTTGYDGRSNAKKILDAIDALLQGKASKDQMSIVVPGTGRRIDRYSFEDLLVIRDRMKAEYIAEVRADRIKSGLSSNSKILVRFPA